MDIKSLTIIIPCYNEVGTIKKVINDIQQLRLKAQKEIIIVDDASTDGSRKIIKSYSNKGIICLFQKRNQGKGAAIKKALKVATGEFVIIQDADLECDPNDIKKLIEHTQKNDLTTVFGSRNLNNGKLGIFDHKHIYFSYSLGGVILTKMINYLFNQNLTDVTVVYKLIKRSLINKLDLKENRFGICVEIASKLGALKETISEVPISYTPRSFKEGKKLRITDGINGFFVICKVFVNSNLAKTKAMLLFKILFLLT